jgi:hypothetical protein
MYWCHALGDHLPAGDDHDHGDEGRQRHEPHRQAVDAQVVVHVEALDPGQLLDELHRRGAAVEAGDQRQRDQEADERPHQRDPAHGAGVLVAADGQQQHAEGDRQPDRELSRPICVLSVLLRSRRASLSAAGRKGHSCQVSAEDAQQHHQRVPVQVPVCTRRTSRPGRPPRAPSR